MDSRVAFLDPPILRRRELVRIILLLIQLFHVRTHYAVLMICLSNQEIDGIRAPNGSLIPDPAEIEAIISLYKEL